MDRKTGRTAMEALTQIPRRAEKQNHRTLSDTFVDIGPLFASMLRPEHQIIYGRRGTGKTHALSRLLSALEENGKSAIYIDLRTIGSAGGIYADEKATLTNRATHLLVDVIEAIHTELLNLCYEWMDQERDVTRLVNSLDGLGQSVTDVEVKGTVEAEETRKRANRQQSKGSLRFEGFTPSLSFGVDSGDEETRETKHRVTGVQELSVKFGPLATALRRVVQCLPDNEMWILLDEWSAIPLDLQPLLADLLRRAVFPIRGITIKIAAIERRSSFIVRQDRGNYTGIELGADAAQDVNLDDYLIFADDDSRAEAFFGDLFLRHTRALVPEFISDFPATEQGRMRFISHIWEDYSSFQELVKSAEGIPRDGINIAGLAAQQARPPADSGRGGITNADIRNGARSWFLRDKEAGIKGDELATRALAHIIRFATSRHKRTFLVERGHDSNHEVIQELYDARLIHLLRSGVGPRGGYDLFALDYGGFVNTLGNTDSLDTWQDWSLQWTDLDPSRSPLVRKAILTVSQLREKPGPGIDL